MADQPANTDEYIAAFPAEPKAVLAELRRVIKEAAPGAEEAFSYKMPAFRYKGRALIWFAAWTDHFSLYPLTEAMQQAHGDELEGFAHAKGTIRFPAGEPLPYDLIARLVRTRVGEIDGGGR